MHILTGVNALSTHRKPTDPQRKPTKPADPQEIPVENPLIPEGNPANPKESPVHPRKTPATPASPSNPHRDTIKHPVERHLGSACSGTWVWYECLRQPKRTHPEIVRQSKHARVECSQYHRTGHGSRTSTEALFTQVQKLTFLDSRNGCLCIGPVLVEAHVVGPVLECRDSEIV